MRKTLLAIGVLISVVLSAQDSTAVKTVAVADLSIDSTPANRLQLYNYTSLSINNLYSESLRNGANNRITIDFDYAANSNSATMGLIYAVLFRKQVTSALKDRVDNNIKDKLRMEDFMKTGITYRRYIKKWDGEVFFSYHHRQMRNVIATKGLYELAFYGNARFAGDTVDISGLRVQNYIYNQYTGGIKKTIDYGKYQMEFGFGLSFLQIIN
ncbi:MAG TPA: hypothetical protein VK174_14530, partial [Chitinophagales bacterium]|nr:hypothetical protein [Chitinophagales bacterium]